MEIVAPAGSRLSLEAAIKAGADACYLGLKGFGARRKAKNFDLDELLKSIDYAHLRGVKLYLTLNTIMRDNEIEMIYNNIKRLYNAGIDAFIIQDFGVYSFLKENFPEIEYHGSTQMTITNHVEADFLENKGFDRVVLAREMSFDDIKSVKKKSNIALEIFVSGALCVSYSGNCYFSSHFGDRSGNRGLCTQPCRKIYKKNNENGYFLSPRDQFFGKKEINMLKSIGADSIKVEGRMKSEKYVFEAVKYYRDLIDGRESDPVFISLFNRGYGKGYFYGKQEELINDKYSFDFGVIAAEKTSKKKFEIIEKLSLGDGISFVDEHLNVIGGKYINRLQKEDKTNIDKVKKGDHIIVHDSMPETMYLYKTFDKELENKISRDMKNKEKQLEINLSVNILVGNSLEMKASYKDIEVIKTGSVIEEAKRAKANSDDIKEKLSQTGETSFKIKNIDLLLDDNAFVPVKMLKECRRDILAELAEKIIKKSKRNAREFSSKKYSVRNNETETVISAIVRNDSQAETLLKNGIEKIYHVHDYIVSESRIDDAESAGIANNITQIVKSKDKISLNWNMNIFNSYAIDFYNKEKIDTIFLSSELSIKEIEKLVKKHDNLGMVIYGRQELMYIEHPVFKEEKTVISNENGDNILVHKNKFNNSEVYSQKYINLIPKLDNLMKMGLKELRLDFTFENSEEVLEVINMLKERTGDYSGGNIEKGVL